MQGPGPCLLYGRGSIPGLDFEDWPLLPTSFLNMYASVNIGDEEFA